MSYAVLYLDDDKSWRQVAIVSADVALEMLKASEAPERLTFERLPD